METVIGQQEIIHKHQVKSAAVDDNISEHTGKITTVKRMVEQSQDQQ